MSLLGSQLPFADLDDEGRQALIALLELRNAFNTQQARHNRLTIAYLESSNEQNAMAIDEFAQQTLDPLREQIRPLERELMLKAVDLDQLKALLPMLVGALLQAIDPELLLYAADMDPDRANFLVDKLQGFLGSGS